MFRSIRLRRVIAALVAASLFSMLACQGDEAPTLVKPGDPPKKQDAIDDGGRPAGHLYGAGSPFHEQRMAGLLQRPEVLSTVASFGAHGFEPAPEHSFTVTGTDGEIGGLVTFVTMNGTGDASGQSAILACVESDGEFGISSAVFSTQPPKETAGWRQIDDQVWIRSVSLQEVSLSSQRVEWWSWEYFWDCIASKLPSVAAGCGLSCYFLGPGYWHCVFVCAAAQSAAATFQCVINTIRSAGKDKKEE